MFAARSFLLLLRLVSVFCLIPYDPNCAIDCAAPLYTSQNFYYPNNARPSINSKEIITSLYNNNNQDTGRTLILNFQEQSVKEDSAEPYSTLSSTSMTNFTSYLNFNETTNSSIWTVMEDGQQLFSINSGMSLNSVHLWWVSETNNRTYAMVSTLPTQSYYYSQNYLFIVNQDGEFISKSLNYYTNVICSTSNLQVFDSVGILLINTACCWSFCEQYWKFTSDDVMFLISASDSYIDTREQSIVDLSSCPSCFYSTVTVFNYNTQRTTTTWQINYSEIPGNAQSTWVWGVVGGVAGAILLTGFIITGFVVWRHRKNAKYEMQKEPL